MKRTAKRILSITLCVLLTFSVLTPAFVPKADAGVTDYLLEFAVDTIKSTVKCTVESCMNIDKYDSAGDAVLNMLENIGRDLIGLDTEYPEEEEDGDTVVTTATEVDLSGVENALADINTVLQKNTASISQLNDNITNGINSISNQINEFSEQFKDTAKLLQYSEYLTEFFSFFNQYRAAISYYDNELNIQNKNYSAEAYKNFMDRFYALEDAEYTGNIHVAIDTFENYLQGKVTSHSITDNIINVLADYYTLAYKLNGNDEETAKENAAAAIEYVVEYFYYTYGIGVYYEQAINLYQLAYIKDNKTDIYPNDVSSSKLTTAVIENYMKTTLESTSATFAVIFKSLVEKFTDKKTDVSYVSPDKEYLNRNVPIDGFKAEAGALLYFDDIGKVLEGYFSDRLVDVFSDVCTVKGTDRDNFIQIDSKAAEDTVREVSFCLSSAEIYTMKITVAVPSSDFAGGFGTEDYPFKIKTTEQFLKIDSTEEYMHASYSLCADLDFSGETFNPIRCFYGTFEGNFNTIKGYTIQTTNTDQWMTARADDPGESETDHMPYYCYGLFCMIKGGTVKDLTVAGDIDLGFSPLGIVPPAKVCCAGVLAGYAEDATFEFCEVESFGSIAVNSSALFGMGDDNYPVYVGGMIGRAKNTTVQSSYVEGIPEPTLKSTGGQNLTFGGIVGYAENMRITDCGNTFDEDTSVTLSTSANAVFGLIAGETDSKTVVEKTWSSKANVSVTGASKSVGGLCGKANDAKFTDCRILKSYEDSEQLFTDAVINADYWSLIESNDSYPFLANNHYNSTGEVYAGGVNPTGERNSYNIITDTCCLTYEEGDYIDLSGLTLQDYIGSGYYTGRKDCCVIYSSSADYKTLQYEDLTKPLKEGTYEIGILDKVNMFWHYDRIVITVKPHYHKFFEITIYPTCTSGGSCRRTCTVCGAETVQYREALGHSFYAETQSEKYIAVKAANCTGRNKYYTSCMLCGASSKGTDYEEIFIGGNMGTHKMTKTEAKAATCITAGNNEYYTCTVCNKVYTDAEGSTETTVEEQTIAPLEHSYTGEIKDNNNGSHSFKCVNGCNNYGGTVNCTYSTEGKLVTEATCTKDAVYTYSCVCGAEKDLDKIGSKLTHSYTGAVKDNKDGTHSFKCVNGCNNYGGAVKHTWNTGKVTTPATCTDKGTTTYTCTVTGCGATYTEAIAATGHKLTKTPAKAATSEADGNNEYYTCSTCKKVYKDAAAKTETSVKNETIAKLSYMLGDVNMDKAITAADARFALRASVGLENYPSGSAKFIAADVDRNGKITSSDARSILRAAVGLDDATKW